MFIIIILLLLLFIIITIIIIVTTIIDFIYRYISRCIIWYWLIDWLHEEFIKNWNILKWWKFCQYIIIMKIKLCSTLDVFATYKLISEK